MSHGLFDHLELSDLETAYDSLQDRLVTLINGYFEQEDDGTVAGPRVYFAGTDADPMISTFHEGEDVDIRVLTRDGALIEQFSEDDEIFIPYRELGIRELFRIANRLREEEELVSDNDDDE